MPQKYGKNAGMSSGSPKHQKYLNKSPHSLSETLFNKLAADAREMETRKTRFDGIGPSARGSSLSAEAFLTAAALAEEMAKADEPQHLGRPNRI
jgi:hypothetical protein